MHEANQLEFNQVVAIVAKSYFLNVILDEGEFERLKQAMPDLASAPASAVEETIPNLEDQICCNIQDDKFLSYTYECDYEEGHDAGPWAVNVYGACGVWLVVSMDYDRLWFSDRDSAIHAAYGYTQESILEEIDLGAREYQQSNSEADQAKEGRDTSSRRTSSETSMDKNTKTGNEVSGSPLPWLEADLEAFNKELSAYGPTVRVVEPSGSGEYKVSFPPAQASPKGSRTK